jgi:hypothetical protein
MTGGRRVRSVAPMINTHTTYRRRGGVALLSGAVLNVAGCIVAAASQATARVPSDLARAPLSHNAAIAVYVLGATAEALILTGIVCLRRSGLPRARAVAIGLGAVIAGTALLSICNLASISIEDQLNNATAPSWVWSGFAVGSLLAVFGMITAGVSISAHAGEPTWRDHAPLFCGLVSLLLLPLESTNTVWLGIAPYALGYAVLGAALVTAPAGRRQAVAQPA